MEVRFLADANLDRNIVAGVLRRDPRIEFELGARVIPPGMKDPEVLAIAASLGCILVTHDIHTMPRHFGEFAVQRSSPGVILVPFTVSIGQAIEEIVTIWHTTAVEEWVDRIVWLPV